MEKKTNNFSGQLGFVLAAAGTIRQILGKEKAEHSCPCSASFRQNFPAFIILRH